MNKVFIDTNIFYNILFETSLTRKARKLLEDYEENKFYTSLTVVNELLYISTRKEILPGHGRTQRTIQPKKTNNKQGISKVHSLWYKEVVGRP